MPRSERAKARISLLTYGCPLGRLYVRAFPGYLGPQVLGAGQPGREAAQTAASVTVRSKASGWLNLYRATDPIGGYVDGPVPETGPGRQAFGPSGAGRNGGIDVLLVDPDFAVPDGDSFPPGAAGHSHYREDPTYEAAVAALLAAP
jgi:hypothetical protein